MSEANLAVARRFLFERNQAAYKQSFDQILAPDVVIHEYVPGMPPAMNRVAYDQFIVMFRAALPDIHNELGDIFAAGDKVCIRWVGYGTHTGAELMGIPARGNTLMAHGIYILRFVEGKIAEVWNHWDNLNVLEQLRAGASAD